jgi:hypothetical protein
MSKTWKHKINHPHENINHGQLMTVLLELQRRVEELEEEVSKCQKLKVDQKG